MFSAMRSFLLISILHLSVFFASAQTETFYQRQVLVPTNLGGYFSNMNVKVDGNFMVMADNNEQVSVFERVNGTWLLKQTLTPSDAVSGVNKRFGSQIAISGDNISVGASGDNESIGAVYFFHKDKNGLWSQTSKVSLAQLNGYYKVSFGATAFALHKTTATAGRGDGLNNRFYVMKQKSDFTWSISDSLFSLKNTYIGDNVVITDSMIVMNSHVWNPSAIFIYPINANGGISKDPQKIAYTSATESSGSFSYKYSRIASDGKRILVGSYDETALIYTVKYPNAGAVYLFEKSNDTWAIAHKFVSDTIIAGDQFGSQVAIENNVVAIGVRYHDFDLKNKNKLFDPGAAYIFKQTASTWTGQKIVNTPRASQYSFGFSIAISNQDVIVGGNGRATVFNTNKDCMNVPAGAAYLDACKRCIGGTSTLTKEYFNVESCSLIAGMEQENDSKSTIGISPNPFDDLGFEIRLNNQAKNIQLLDMNGVTIVEGDENAIANKTKNLKKGMYLIRIQFEDNSIAIEKVVKL